MTPKQPLDFNKVEALRKYMLLTVSNMAELLGTSRMTYYGWVSGKPIRRANEQIVRTVLKRLLHVVTVYGWPTEEILTMGHKQRKAKLLELLSQDQH